MATNAEKHDDSREVIHTSQHTYIHTYIHLNIHALLLLNIHTYVRPRRSQTYVSTTNVLDRHFISTYMHCNTSTYIHTYIHCRPSTTLTNLRFYNKGTSRLVYVARGWWHTHTYIDTYTHAYTYTYAIHTYTCICKHTRIKTHTKNIPLYTDCAEKKYIWSCERRKHINTYIRCPSNALKHTQILLFAHTYTHKHIHKYKQRYPPTAMDPRESYTEFPVSCEMCAWASVSL